VKKIFAKLFADEFARIEFAGWEWAIMRIGMVPLIWLATWHTFDVRILDIPDIVDSKAPNGLAGVMSFSWLVGDVATWIVAGLMAVLLLLYLFGKCMLVATAGLLLIHMAVGAIFSSPAGTHHATQIVGFVLLGQVIWFVWQTWRIGSKRNDGRVWSEAQGAVFFSQQMIAAAYVVSAISKWVNSGGGWFPGWRWVQQLPNIAVQFEKNHMQKYYDELVMPAAALNRGMIDFVIDHPTLAKLVIGPAFYLELLAFLVLLNRRISALLGLGLIGMHLIIAQIMHLEFFYFEMIGLLFLVNVPYWVGRMMGKSCALPSEAGSSV
jgi:hypothetical protein